MVNTAVRKWVLSILTCAELATIAEAGNAASSLGRGFVLGLPSWISLSIVGLEYQFADLPFDVFLEIGPGINIMPSTEPNFAGGLGSRFFF